MISYRHADLRDKVGPRILVIGIDTNHVIRMQKSEQTGKTLGFTVPVCFRPMSNMTNKDMDIIDHFLYNRWETNTYPLGYVEQDDGEWYAVDENNIDRNVLIMMKNIIGDGLRSLGFNIIESKEVPYAIAMEYELEHMIRTADLRDRIKSRSPLIGLPVRRMFRAKPGASGIITKVDAEKIYFRTEDNVMDDWVYSTNSEVSERSGRVYVCTDNERAKYIGSYMVVTQFDNKNLGRITDIHDGFIETNTNKKIDSYNWGMQIDDSSRIIRMSK